MACRKDLQDVRTSGLFFVLNGLQDITSPGSCQQTARSARAFSKRMQFVVKDVVVLRLVRSIEQGFVAKGAVGLTTCPHWNLDRLIAFGAPP